MPNWPPHRFVTRRRLDLPTVLSALALSVLCCTVAERASASQITSEAEPVAYQIPPTIAGDCSVDVTQPILSWIASVPNNSILSFGSNACYRVDGTLELTNRNGLDFQGNGATFRAMTEGTLSRAHWRLIGGSQTAFRNMTIRGANPTPGRFVPNLQHQHAIDLRGTAAVEIENVSIASPYGDCVYVGRPWGTNETWSSAVHAHDSSCIGPGRNGVAVTAGRDVLFETSRFGTIGLNAFDVEPSGVGFGATNVTFTRNEVGSVAASVFAALGEGTINSVTVSQNTVVGRGLYLAALAPTGRRYTNIAVVGNVSNTGYYAPGSVAMDFVRIDGLTVTGNNVRLSGPNMALADVAESCSVNVSGNSYPGGVEEARIHPYDCRQQAPPPTISSVSPTSGPVGTSVTITGANFTGASAVAFNGTSASFAVNSATQITAVVPSGATSGAISVTTPGGTATGAWFTVTVTVASPSIASFTPESGQAGTSVTITGANFTGASAVAFNGTSASFTVNSSTRITATVPNGATSGTITVTTPAGMATSKRFRVTTSKRRATDSKRFRVTNRYVVRGRTTAFWRVRVRSVRRR